MLNWFDFVLILIIVFSLITGYVRGFIGTLFKIFSLILGIFLGKTFAFEFSVLLQNLFGIGYYFKNILSEKFINLIIPAEIASLPMNENIKNIISSLPSFLRSIIDIGKGNKIFPVASTLGETVINGVATIILVIISFVIIFILTYIICSILGIFLRRLIKTFSIVRLIDGILGALLNISITIALILLFILIIFELDIVIKNNNIAFFKMVKDSYLGSIILKELFPKFNEWLINFLKIKIK